MRKDCVFSTLTEDQQADLFHWLSTQTYDAVLKRIAQKPPKGFGIKTHINSLHRFFHQRQAQLRALDLADAMAAQDSSGADSELKVQNAFISASKSGFAHATYTLAHSPLTPETYRALARALHQNEDIAVKREFLDLSRQQLSLARDRLQLDRTRFEYNVAQAAFALLPDLVAIHQSNGIDDETKIARVRDRLFGPPSSIESGPGDEKISRSPSADSAVGRSFNS